jgi:hypothetical protein
MLVLLPALVPGALGEDGEDMVEPVLVLVADGEDMEVLDC